MMKGRVGKETPTTSFLDFLLLFLFFLTASYLFYTLHLLLISASSAASNCEPDVVSVSQVSTNLTATMATEKPLGLDEMLVARWLARFMVSSARLGSARLNFFTSRADILARFVNEPARFVNEPAHELNELPYSSKRKLYAYHLQNN
jgi:hypothetical protein